MNTTNNTKTYAKEATAKTIATKMTNKTGNLHIVLPMEDGTYQVMTKAEADAMATAAHEAKMAEMLAAEAKSDVEVARATKGRPVTAEFMFDGDDERYFFVKVENRRFKLAKSRVTGTVVEGFITVNMSVAYAATRPELKLAA